MTRNGNDKLWEKANAALIAGRWGEARSALDDLSYFHGRSAVDKFAMPASAPDYVRDRVELWNAQVESASVTEYYRDMVAAKNDIAQLRARSKR